MNRLDLIRILILYNFKLSTRDIKRLLDIVNRLELSYLSSELPKLYLKTDKKPERQEYKAIYLSKYMDNSYFMVNASMRYKVSPKYWPNKGSSNNLKMAKIFVAELEILK